MGEILIHLTQGEATIMGVVASAAIIGATTSWINKKRKDKKHLKNVKITNMAPLLG